MKVSDAIFEYLKQYVDTVFFVPGGGAMHLNDGLRKSGLRAVSMLHEQGAGFAALAYAQYRGLGVCLTTSGPGATNAITACAAAWTDSVPVLFISGQARSDTLVGNTGLRTRGVQEIDIIPMVKPITKDCCQPEWFTSVSINDFVRICQSGRPGPCWLSVPLDVQAMEVLDV